jgi:hypothetical protein
MDNQLLLKISKTLQKTKRDIASGSRFVFPEENLVETGFATYLDESLLKTTEKKERAVTSLTPEGVILVKKKAFSSLVSNNDVRFFDKTERMLMRASKALFAYKVQQIRAYESLTKFEKYYTKTGTYSMNLLASLLRQSSFLTKDVDSFQSLFQKKLQYKTAEDYASAMLKDWLLKPSDLTVDDSISLVASDVKAKNGILKKEVITPTTNQQYLASLPSTQAKYILDKKYEEYKAQFSSEISKDVISVDSYIQSLSTSEKFQEGIKNEYANMQLSDLIELIKRNAYSQDSNLTTWIVDADSLDNYLTGPGTGVIEIASFTSFQTNCTKESSASTATFALEYPYGISFTSEDDIEIAIEEALKGTLGIFSDLLMNGFKSSANGITKPGIDGLSYLGASALLNGFDLIDSTVDINYIRKSLRTFYLGKPIVNASDVCHFYIRGNRFKQRFGSSSENIVTDESEYGISDTVFKAEYELYTNKSISYDEYKKLRKEQDNSIGMVHVFAGYIKSVSERYTGGFRTVDVSCVDNMGWLSWSNVPRQPALADVTGILEDPLTPYKLVTDDMYTLDYEKISLLDENKELLSAGMLSYSNGLLAGKNATIDNIYQGQFRGIGSLDGSKILQHADGFVYRWKTGVITATAGFQTTGSKSTKDLQQYTQYYAVSAVKNPVNNLDIANIISVLITGEPYNILSFIEKASIANKSDRYSATLNPQDALTGYLESIKRQNKIYGNFKPYRLFTQNSYTLNILTLQGKKQELNNEVEKLLNRKNKLNDQVIKLRKTFNNEKNPIILTIQAEIRSIDKAIDQKIGEATSISNTLNSAQVTAQGLSVSALFGEGESVPFYLGSTKEEHEEIVRAISKVGATRRIEDVRMNRDQNLLIISDQYDTSDIRPFILGLNNSQFKKFDGEYESLDQLCREAASYIHMEFFCNSQGHIELRPPQWNKTPLSLLRNLVKYKKLTGKNIIPDFIIKNFETREKSIYENIYYLNIRIVLISLLLGRFPDETLIPSLKYAMVNTITNEDSTGKNVSTNSLRFFGVSIREGEESPKTSIRKGTFEYKGSTTASGKSNASRNLEKSLYISATYLEDFKSINSDTSTILGGVDAISAALNNLTTDLQNVAMGTGSPIATSVATKENLNNIRTQFKKLTGRDAGSSLMNGSEFEDVDFAFGNSDDVSSRVDSLLKYLNQAISTRDSYVRLLKSNEERQKELELAIDTISNQSANETTVVGTSGFSNVLGRVQQTLERTSDAIQTVLDVITGDSYKSSPFDNLIEDDFVNDIGYGSGKRYIINDEDIIDATFNESQPEFTRADVFGDTPLNLTGDLASQTDGTLLWAGATDFDLWRQYGYKTKSINIPFITDAETMGKPYAILELILQNAEVNSGTLSVIGNEFYQPGDTVYIPSKNLLYYIASVNHSFSYASQSFSTSLQLKMGRPPGIYIPNPMDILGQSVLGAIETPTLVYRTSQSDDNYRPLTPESSLKIPDCVYDNSCGNNQLTKILSYQENNSRFTSMMSYLSTGVLSSGYFLLLRAFVRSQDDNSAITKANNSLEAISGLFQNPVQYVDNGISNQTQQMRLPNLKPSVPINKEKIIQQISFINKEEGSSDANQIKCMDSKLYALINSSKQGLSDPTSSGYDALFPKDGPRQTTWLSLRDNFRRVLDSNGLLDVIEVGIIYIPGIE